MPVVQHSKLGTESPPESENGRFLVPELVSVLVISFITLFISLINHDRKYCWLYVIDK
ncbi:hypothetical protein BDA96_07G041300 [Sorghum bicolor]|uniref:Uncharacterized protein n=1 Tax=Sorghum bicolor TaxID=4558 RepID=A0A921QL81_SORBI|nr:hypothetical protein BDA96_07G041300 [Sorghum bicolor]